MENIEGKKFEGMYAGVKCNSIIQYMKQEE